MFALVAISTDGWWQTDQVKHGLWRAQVNDQSQKILIGQAVGYKGLETVRGFGVISVLVLLSGLITSILSLIPKYADKVSAQVGVWTYATSAIFISKKFLLDTSF